MRLIRDHKWFFVAMIALIVFLAPFALHAQVDVTVPIYSGPYQVIANNLTWNVNGSGGLGNNFILVPPSPDSSLCLFVQNSDSAAHQFTYSVYSTGNPQVTSYAGNTAVWTQTNNGQLSVTASGTVSLYLASRSSARLAIVASGTGSTSTATLYGVWTQNSACGLPVTSLVGTGSVYGNLVCDHNVTTSLTAGTTNSVVAAPSAPFTKLYVCSVLISIPAGAAANATVQVGTGRQLGDCGAYSSDFFIYVPTTAYTLVYGSNIGFILNGTGTPLCATSSSGIGTWRAPLASGPYRPSVRSSEITCADICSNAVSCASHEALAE